VNEAAPVLYERDQPGRHFVELRLDGRAVSHGNVLEVPTRIGSAVVTLGGIGGVFTTPPRRNKGYNRRVMERLVEWMAEQRYDLSALWGIEDYYHRFGYAPCMPTDRLLLLCVRTPAERNRALRVRRMRKADFPAAARLYEGVNAGRTGTAVRRPGTWSGFRHGSRYRARPDAVVVAEDGRGRLVGYAAYERVKRELLVCEAIGRDTRACETLLARLLGVARRNKLHQVVLHQPPGTAMGDVCRKFDCKVHTGFSRNGGGMARVVDQTSLLRKLAPELTRRLRASACRRRRARIRIRTELGADDLVAGRGMVRWSALDGRAGLRLRMPHQALAQLVCGYRAASGVLAEQGLRLSREEGRLVDALFPRDWYYTWWPDRY